MSLTMKPVARAAVVSTLAGAVACAHGAGPAPVPASPALAGQASTGSPGSPAAPSADGADTRQGVVEELHGVKVADPYRWLEDDDSPAVKQWVTAQGERTRKALSALAEHDAIVARTKAILHAGGEVTAPELARSAHGPSLYFHTKRAGDLDQAVLYVREGAKGADRVLIDPSKLTADPTTAIDWWFASRDGAFVTYGYSKDGTELSTLHVRDVKTGADLPDAIPFTRYASVCWVPDNKGFYYTRFPEPGAVPSGEEQQHQRVYFHRLGADWHKDKLVYEPPRREDHVGLALSPGGRWLVASLEVGYSKNEIYVRDRSKGDAAKWSPVATGVEARFEAIPREERLYLVTTDGAPNKHVYVIEYDHTDRTSWREVLHEGKDAIQGVTVLRTQMVVATMHDASTHLERFALSGKSLGPIALPGVGSASVTGAWDTDEAFIEYESFVQPQRVLRVDPRTAKTEPWDSVGEVLEATDVETTVRYATSKDGTKVPIFVVAKKGLPLDGSSPTLLWGYGGFDVNQTPTFRPYAVLAVEHGGVFASTVLRGGGELGEGWHRAGMLGKKQNVFDDYFACAQELFTEKVTSPEKLVAIGRSNGGLLVAAAITQHPEMFRAAVSIVPLTDMVRYPRFRIGSWWVSEYGDPAKEEDFQWLYAYSPYHHVKDGARYPATLISTGESDNRVDPMHSRKMAARLEEAQGDSSRPVLLRVDTNAGHGQGKPASKLAEQIADEVSFALDAVGARAGGAGAGSGGP